MLDRRGTRVARTAAAALGVEQAVVAGRLSTVRVLLELGSDSADAVACLHAAVRQAVVMWSSVTVRTASAAEAAGCIAVAEELRPGERAVHWGPEARHADFDGVLHIGGATFADPKVVSVTSTGWVAHVYALGAAAPAAAPVQLPENGSPNAVTATGAAALGIGELFLRTLGLDRTLAAFDLSLFDYRIGPLGALDPGPALPSALEINGVLVGAGTVGAGFAFAVSLLDLRGSLEVVDHDAGGPQNFGPHLYVASDTNGIAKAQIVAEHLHADHPALDVKPRPERLRLYRYRLGNGVPRPDVVISGLDKARPRNEVQRLWAPLHIDMATDAGLQLQVMVRTVPGSGLCLIRRFPIADEADEEDEIAARTGLTREAIGDELSDVTDEDVARAREPHRAAIAAARARGERRCNLITRGDIRNGSDSDEYVGSAPFTALFAGVIAAAELVKARVLGLDRDGTFVLWHFVSRNVFTVRTRCASDCECSEAQSEAQTSRARG